MVLRDQHLHGLGAAARQQDLVRRGVDQRGDALAQNIHMRARKFAAHEWTQLFIRVAHGLLEGGLHGRRHGAEIAVFQIDDGVRRRGIQRGDLAPPGLVTCGTVGEHRERHGDPVQAWPWRSCSKKQTAAQAATFSDSIWPRWGMTTWCVAIDSRSSATPCPS